MKDLNASLRGLKFDTRMIDWNLKHGIISQTELDDHLKALADEAEKVEFVNLNEEKGTTEN